MVSAGAIRFAAGIIGNITALVLFLSPVPTFIGICKKKTVQQYSPIPYLATFVNCMLWVVYGMPFIHPHSILVVTINGAGFFIELLYLILFVIYSDKKKRIKIVLIAIGEIIIVGIMTALVLTFAPTTKLRSSVVGIIGVICNILMYASPLSVMSGPVGFNYKCGLIWNHRVYFEHFCLLLMKLVIKTKSVEYMPFTLSMAAFANGIAWTIYALFPFDPYIAAPNGVGSLFALVQLILYATYYKSTKEQLAARKAKTAVGLSEVVYNNGYSGKVGQNGRA